MFLLAPSPVNIINAPQVLIFYAAPPRPTWGPLEYNTDTWDKPQKMRVENKLCTITMTEQYFQADIVKLRNN